MTMKPSYDIEKWAAVARRVNARLSNSEAIAFFIEGGELRYCAIQKEWQVYPRPGNFYWSYSNKAALQREARFVWLVRHFVDNAGVPYPAARRIAARALRQAGQ